ncbi:MAG TPA: lysoplasmalogenase family protein [Clostridia bacterium]|nr:lysoplasmalogenase family protein [Clostridia bacterium]
MLLTIKLIFMGLLSVAAIALAFLRGQGFYVWAAAALLFSWLGDAMLGAWRPLARRVANRFLAGMGFFGCAQLCYALAFGLYLLDRPDGSVRAVVFLAVALAAGWGAWRLLISGSKRDGFYRYGALAYALLLFAMAGLAGAACFHAGRFVWPLLLGALLFVASDGLIAMSVFRNKTPAQYELLVWATYAPAQLLLLTGLVLLR